MDTASIISEWPGTQALADDLGVNVETVRQWRKRDSIPAKHWQALCERAKARGVDWITPAELSRRAATPTADTAA